MAFAAAGAGGAAGNPKSAKRLSPSPPTDLGLLRGVGVVRPLESPHTSQPHETSTAAMGCQVHKTSRCSRTGYAAAGTSATLSPLARPSPTPRRPSTARALQQLHGR
eukprot:1195339-Prorocentrum_minimum.AAC.2